MGDMSATDAIKSGILPPAGLVNLMNTCYANSVIQVLHKIPELEDAVKTYPDSGSRHSGCLGGGIEEDVRGDGQFDHGSEAFQSDRRSISLF